MSRVESRGAEQAANSLELLRDDLLHQRSIDHTAIAEERAVAYPLPDLRARDLGRRGVFHQIIDRDAAVAAEPGFEVLNTDVDVHFQSGLRNFAFRAR